MAEREDGRGDIRGLVIAQVICAMLIVALFLSARANSVAASTDQSPQPGLWELTSSTADGGRGLDQRCFDADAIVRDAAAPLRPRARTDSPLCDTGPIAMTDGRALYETTCTGPTGSMRIEWAGTYTPTGFHIAGKIRNRRMSAAATLDGRRLGPCAS